MRLRSSLGVLLVVALLLLAGCSGTSSSSAASPTPTASSPSSPAPTSASDNFGANGTLEVHFIDVGQGSSTLLVGPTNETMLIDSGDWQDDGESVIEYLQQEDVTRIDYLITSHADADHIGGHAAVIDYLETEGDGVGAVYDPGIAASTQTYEEYLDAVEEHDVTLYRTRAGDPIPFDGVQVDVLAPPEDTIANGDRNENSLVLLITFGDSIFLFPGDAAELEEQFLVEQYGSELDSTVLQAGHHGSRSSSSGPFLDAVSPSVAIISSDYDSRYGHPHNETLERLAEREITTLWTGIHGSIALISDGSEVIMLAQSQATTDPIDLRSAPALTGEETREFIQIGEVTAASGSTVVTDGGSESTPAAATESPSADGSLAIDSVHADAAGNDRENLNDEYVVFTNTGETTLDLAGWTVEDDAGHEYTFPDEFTLDPGAFVTLHTGSGTDSSTELYWGSSQPIWNNDGDTIIVTDAEGQRVLEESY